MAEGTYLPVVVARKAAGTAPVVLVRSPILTSSEVPPASCLVTARQLLAWLTHTDAGLGVATQVLAR